MNARGLWALMLLTCVASHAPNALAESAPRVAPLDVSALAVAGERLYVGSFDAGLYVIEAGRAPRVFADRALDPHINALAWSASDRVLWVATARGLVRCPTGAACVRLGPEGGVHALALASDGALVAGGDAGLVFVDGERVRTFGKKDGAPFRSVWALAVVEGRLYVGTTSGLFWGTRAAFAGKNPSLGRAAIVLNSLPDDWVTALDERDGKLFVGTYSAGIATFRSSASPLVPIAFDTTLGYVNPAGITALGGDCVAIATMDGLRFGALGHTELILTRARDVTAIVPASHGGFWVGTRVGVEHWDASAAQRPSCPVAGCPSCNFPAGANRDEEIVRESQ